MDFSELKKAAEDYRDRPGEANFEQLAAIASDEECGVLALLAENDALRAVQLGKITLSGCELKLRDLIEGVVRNVEGPSKYRNKYGSPRWALVRDAFGVGSGVATALCREFGYDPDEYLRS
jgi:hypothetical protein